MLDRPNTMPLSYTHAFVALAASNFEPLVQFYAHLLGVPPAPYTADRYAEFQLSGVRLGIFKPSAHHESQFAPTPLGSMSLCLEVADLEDAIQSVQATYAALQRQALIPDDLTHPISPVITASHGREVYVHDPANNRLILHEARR